MKGIIKRCQQGFSWWEFFFLIILEALLSCNGLGILVEQALQGEAIFLKHEFENLDPLISCRGAMFLKACPFY